MMKVDKCCLAALQGLLLFGLREVTPRIEKFRESSAGGGLPWCQGGQSRHQGACSLVATVSSLLCVNGCYFSDRKITQSGTEKWRQRLLIRSPVVDYTQSAICDVIVTTGKCRQKWVAVWFNCENSRYGNTVQIVSL